MRRKRQKREDAAANASVCVACYAMMPSSRLANWAVMDCPGEGAFEGADVVGVLLDEQVNGLGGDVVSVHGGRHAQDCRSGFERWSVKPHHDA